MYISIGFIIFYLYLLLSSLSADFTRFVRHYPCLYCLPYFAIIHVLIIEIRGRNWGICEVTKRAVTGSCIVLIKRNRFGNMNHILLIVYVAPCQGSGFCFCQAISKKINLFF